MHLFVNFSSNFRAIIDLFEFFYMQGLSIEIFVCLTPSLCNQRFYVLNVLRGLNMKCKALDYVCNAILSRLLCGIEVWGNFKTKELQAETNKTLKKCPQMSIDSCSFAEL